jgi:asparagine synthase (glutamine-hydrolysing)
MAHSLETRSPLVDYKVVEYAASIPGGLKLKGNQLKYVLRKVAARYLPRDLIDRRKQGFGFPLAIWMRTELRDFVRNLFAESRFVELGIFERSYVQRMIDEHVAGRIDHNYRLWLLINLEVWYRMLFDGMSVEAMQQETERLMGTAGAAATLMAAAE